ncbi:MAG: FRG domain protein [Syntrophorhabdus sp. PtaU1.Bin050]|nr:MAG: FRG domain protein [Syntrophorhabdus sp. PtaU1.Bin050]
MSLEGLVSSWSEFEAKIKEIKETYATSVPPICYRGQADATWKLETTLERYSKSRWTVENYLKLALQCAPEIESFTNQRWYLMKIEQIKEKIREQTDDVIAHIPHLDFLIYLRHHGFPSPLLDWTFSPYVAAFFALSEPKEVENAAVFAYVKTTEGVEGGVAGAPRIKPIITVVRTDRRHFLQQATYTVCTEVKGELNQGSPHIFVSHELVREKASKRQDIVIEIDISREKRVDFLSRLNESNINEFSLFQSEEALMKTLAFRRIEQVGR